MKIAIIGAGRMGSAFAWHLAKAGHEVTVVARGERLAQLQRDGAIESVKGERATVTAVAELDLATVYDGVLVTVLSHQLVPVLPTLKASKAKQVVFLFNNLGSLQPLRDAVGADRAVFGFPAGFVLLIDGKLRASFTGPGQIVTIDSQAWAETFKSAGMPSEVQPDMEAFLRTHAAMVIPMMASAAALVTKGRVTFSEARRYARVLKEGGAIVEGLGHTLTPSSIATMFRLPVFLGATVIYLMNKLAVQRELGSMGPGEVRELIDAMQALAPGKAPEMLAMRP